MVFGEAVPLCQHDVFSPCLAARLCAVSQDRQTDRQGISDVFTICSGRTDVMGEDEEERHFHGVRRQGWGASEDLLPDINHYLSERPLKHWCTLCGTVILNLEDRSGIVNDAVLFIIQDPPGIWTPKVTGR